jgi:hypothetical protein
MIELVDVNDRRAVRNKVSFLGFTPPQKDAIFPS